jgi:hypothetical protein
MSTTYHRCGCPHCHQDLEYPGELAAQVINCPMCSQAITLPAAVAVAAPPARSFFQRFKDAGQAVLDKRKLKSLLLDSVNDGVLTASELAEIRSVLEQTGIDKGILAEWSDDILDRAIDSISLPNLSSERIESVEHIAQFLGVDVASVPKQFQRLNRWKYIAGIREGNLPVQDVANVVLRKGETVHWTEPAKLWEERVVSRRYEGSYSGMSFRIAKGVTFRTGGSRGQFVTDTADVPISEGLFVITSHRLIFQGQAKSFDTKYEKIVDINNHLDGIRYSESNKQKPRKLQYYSSNGDVIVEILSQVFNRYGAAV